MTFDSWGEKTVDSNNEKALVVVLYALFIFAMDAYTQSQMHSPAFGPNAGYSASSTQSGYGQPSPGMQGSGKTNVQDAHAMTNYFAKQAMQH